MSYPSSGFFSTKAKITNDMLKQSIFYCLTACHWQQESAQSNYFWFVSSFVFTILLIFQKAKTEWANFESYHKLFGDHPSMESDGTPRDSFEMQSSAPKSSVSLAVCKTPTMHSSMLSSHNIAIEQTEGKSFSFTLFYNILILHVNVYYYYHSTTPH